MAYEIDLESLSVDDLQQLIRDAEKAIVKAERRRLEEARAEAEAVAQKYGLSLQEVFGGVGSDTKPKAKNPPKYRHPDDVTLTWSGRGRMPEWLKQLTEAGRDREEFLIEQLPSA